MKQANIQDIHPLTPLQEGLLFHSLRGRESDMYVVQTCFRVAGRLDIRRFEEAWNVLFRRHDALRSVFSHEQVDRLLQVVLKERRCELGYEDLRKLAPEAQSRRLQAFERQDRENTFDLSSDVLLRVKVFELGGDDFYVVETHHHIVMDGWSSAILYRELQEIYRALAHDQSPALGAPVSYARFVDWSTKRDHDRAASFWSEYLSGIERPTTIPSYGGPASARSSVGLIEHRFSLSREHTAALQRLAAENQVTLHTVVQCLWATLLCRWNDSTDVLFGSTVSIRPETVPGSNDLVGLMINTIPKRVRAGGARTFGELLRATQDDSLAAGEHAFYPLHKLSAAAGGRELLEHLLVYENYPVEGALTSGDGNGGGLALRHFRFNEATHYDFVAIVVPGEELLFRFVANPAVHPAAQLASFEGHLRALIARLLEAKSAPLSDLDILQDAERELVLRTFNQTTTDYPRGRTIHELFDEQARRTPDHLAVSAGEQLTYAELGARADHLAAVMRQQFGVREGDLVGIMLERSAEMVISLLAILKAGGGYVPLDHADPSPRIHHLLKQTGSRVVLTTAELAEKLPEGCIAVDVHRLPSSSAAPTSEPASSAEGVAYVLFTSGSTGAPKGVIVEHRAVVRLVKNTSFIDIREEDRILQTGALSFDASTFEIWGALLNGASLILPGDRELLDVSRAGEIIRDEGVTVMWLTSSLFNQFMDRDPSIFRGLRALIVGGERLSPPHVRRFRAAHPGTVIINGYGPTEGTTFTCCHRIEEVGDSDIPIGKPIANTRIYILDRRNKPVPIGTRGMLWIAGDGLSRGYLGDEALTKERFVPCPFEENGRMYRSGDMASWLPDGAVAYLGREDDQVKIRGHRVELGEVQAALSAHPGVSQAVAVARAARGGYHELVAYIVGSASLDVTTLRDSIQQKLPQYLVPSRFVVVDSLPLTANGKVDKAALPDPETASAGSGARYSPPETDVQRKLAEIWQEVLGLQSVGVDDHYFHLGGDSIKAILIMARLRKAGLKCEMRTFFERPTIRGLSEHVIPLDRWIPQQRVSGRVPLTPIQEWLWKDVQGSIRHMNQSVLLRAEERLDEGLLTGAFEALVRHHDALRMVFRVEAGAIVQMNRPSMAFKLEVVDLREDPSATLEGYADAAQAGFSLDAGPLLRVLLFRQHDADALLIVIHHLVVDGVSWRILFEDLSTAYEQLSRGERVSLPPKTHSYKAWSEALRRYGRAPELAKELEYWSATASASPVEMPRNEDASAEADRRSMTTLTATLEPSETEDLLTRIGPAYNTRVNDVLLTALARAFKRWNGAEKTLITLESHGRENPLDLDISRTVGWFTAMYPASLDPGPGTDIGQQIRTIKEALRAVPSGGFGFGVLKYIAKAPLAVPTPSVSFNYLGVFEDRLPSGRFRFSGEQAGQTVGADVALPGALFLNAAVLGGRLSIAVSFDAARLRSQELARLLEVYTGELRAVIRHCLEKTASERTPSDFTWGHLSLAEFDGVLRILGRSAADVVDVYPLSPMQEGLLFHALRDKESAAFFQQMAYKIEGKLDSAAFEAAWNHLVSRHTALRTAFVFTGLAQPLQVVLRERPIEFRSYDLRGSASEPGEIDRRVAAYMEADRKRPFDMERDVLIRVALFETGGDELRMVWSFHHILLDGWCLSILNRELLQAYDAIKLGRSVNLGPARPYSDYYRWLARQDRAGAEAYWRAYVAGFNNPTVVPPYTPRADSDARGVRSFRFSLSKDLTAALKQMAAAHGVTLNTVFQSVWAIFLSRFNNASDVVFGVTVSGRPEEVTDVEKMIGLFINTLPKRVALEPDATLAELLRRVQDDSVRSSRHEFFPLAEIQAMSSPKQRLFDHILVYENFPEEVVLEAKGREDGLRFSYTDLYQELNYPLSVLVSPGETLDFQVLYDSGVYPTEQIEQLQSFLTTLANEILGSAHKKLRAIEIWPDANAGPSLELGRTPGALVENDLKRAFEARLAEILDPRTDRAVRVCVVDAYGHVTPQCVPGEVVIGRATPTGFRGRWLWDGSLEITDAPEAWIARGGAWMPVSRLASLISEVDAVTDCVVTKRAGAPIAIVASVDPSLEARVFERLSGEVPAPILDDLTVVVVPALPLDEAGELDKAALDRAALLDARSIRALESELNTVEGVKELVAVAQAIAPETPHAHLFDLLPADKSRSIGQAARDTAADDAAAQDGALRDGNADEDARDVQLALSDGGPLEIDPAEPRTLADALYRAARQFGHKGTYYVRDDGTELFQSYAQLLHEAKCILNGLQQLGVKSGDSIILQFQDLHEHLTSFWACIIGGIRPVTVAVSPTYAEKTSVVMKLYHAWKLLEQPLILTSKGLVPSIEGINALFDTTAIRAASISPSDYAPVEPTFVPDPKDVIFYQLTSGSTGVPKCIQESNWGIYHHVYGAAKYNDYTSDDVFLNWPPADHVGSLLTLYIKGVFLGVTQVAVRPETILHAPLKWLDLIQEHKVTFTWCPNFGYKLVSDALKKTDRAWDLSTVRYFLNAAEQVTYPVVKEFLELTRPFGVPQRAMQPAYGMAETCTAMQYKNDFDVETGFHWFDKSSIKGILKKTPSRGRDAVCFVNLGRPMYGVKIRIVNEKNQLVPEGKIGSLHISGHVITPGYKHNPEANREAFVGDGWFNTGDLGLILNGELSITGRQKEIIIIRGANFYCYEIEDVVSTVPGVEPTFAGATAIEDPLAGTEGLAIFFSPKPGADLVEVNRAVRSRIASVFGVNPTYVVPIDKSVFPKTTSGKIQRLEMKAQLERGAYDDVIKPLDVALKNTRTLPDWWFTVEWHRKALRGRPRSQEQRRLVLCNDVRLRQALARSSLLKGDIILVETGACFERRDARSYVINPRMAGDYKELVRSLANDGAQIEAVVHALGYQPTRSECLHVEDLEERQYLGALGGMLLLQALGERAPSDLMFVTSRACHVVNGEPFAYEMGTLGGFLRTLAQERPDMRCGHIDLDGVDAERDAEIIAAELACAAPDMGAAYRKGARFVPLLRRVDWPREARRPIPFKHRGFYLITGGLGGIGRELGSLMLTLYEARLLLVGRTDVAQDHERLEALHALRRTGKGDVRYAQADVGDIDAISRAVAEAERAWGEPLAGILHLADLPSDTGGEGLQAHSILHEPLEGYASMYRAKVYGAFALMSLLEDRKDAVFVGFSSINGFFGGAGVAPYASASSFVDALCTYERQVRGRNAYSFGWSMWDGVGMSRGNMMREAVLAKGFEAIPLNRGLLSFLVAAELGHEQILIGLNPDHPRIREKMLASALPAYAASLHYEVEGQPDQTALERTLKDLTRIHLKDVFPVRAFVHEHLERLADGSVDRGALRATRADQLGGEQETRPLTPAEATLVGIWSDTLGVRNPSIYANFFELGGDSIKAIQIMSRLHNAGLRCEMKHLFQYPVISSLAPFLTTSEPLADQGLITGIVPLTPIQRRFFEEFDGPKHHFNQAVLLVASEPLVPSALKAAFEAILVQHDALRATYREEDGAVVQEIRAAVPLYLETVDLTQEAEPSSAVTRHANRLQASINLENGPLMKVAHFRCKDHDELLIIVHHLVVDGISWRILLEDVARAYALSLKGCALRWQAKTASFKDWSAYLVESSKGARVAGELGFWSDIVQAPVEPLPARSSDRGSHAESRTLRFTLSADETKALLSGAHHAFHTRINDVLLTALARALTAWHGGHRTRIALESHGREYGASDIDVSRTVGWFTSIYPVLLEVPPHEDLGAHLRSVKETLRRIPGNGAGFGILRYLTRSLADPSREVVTFNYLGQFDQDLSDSIFRLAEGSSGEPVADASRLPYDLSFVGITVNGRFSASVNFNPHKFDVAVMQGVLDGFQRELSQIVTFCATRQRSEPTPSDFTWPNLTLAELDVVTARAGTTAAMIQDLYTLSPMQSGMLFEYLMQKSDSAYFLQFDHRVEGSLDVNVFEAAWNLLFARHDILRTVFLHDALSEPLQIVLKERRVGFAVEDLRGMPPEEQDEHIQRAKEEDRRRSFDLKNDVLMRFQVFKATDDRFRVVWSFHHIILDGWCFGILYREFLAAYQALCEGQRPALPPPTPYARYIAWLANTDSELSARHWRAMLGGLERSTGIPRSSRIAAQSSSDAHDYLLFEWDGDTTARLQKLAARYRVTLYTVLQAIWGILLARYNCTQDVVFGHTVSGRPESVPGIENMVGLFINTVPARVHVDDQLTLGELLARVQADAVESAAHLYYPLYKILADCPLGSALFDHIIAFENYPFEEALSSSSNRFPYFQVRDVTLFEHVNYDFALFITVGATTHFRLEYSPAVYEAGLIRKLEAQLGGIARSLLDNPHVRVGDVELLGAEERAAMLRRWNETAAPPMPELCVHSLFERQADATPEAIAVKCGSSAATYRELNERANEIARRLLATGVGPEAKVGVSIERSIDMVAALLGALKAGSGYVPLDPALPGERLAYMINDAELRTVILRPGSAVAAQTTEPLILDASRSVEPAENPEHTPLADNIAYVIYTSGSTGKPKGVQVLHRGLSNVVQAFRGALATKPGDVLLAVTTISFDIAALELFLPLVSGATVVLATEEDARDPRRLVALIDAHDVNIMQATPATFSAMLPEWRGKAGLTVLCGGEALPRPLAEELSRRAGAVYNVYGPTETTIWSTATDRPLAAGSTAPSAPLGEPVAGTQIYVLDGLRVAPTAAPGELYLAGAGLARGYLRNARSTAERFVPNPFAATPGERMYRTGDLVRWSQDEQLEFIGRVDQQLKIRGHRIEPGEIEAVLAEHPAVQACAVVARTNPQNGDAQLAAYVVPAPRARSDAGAREPGDYVAQWQTTWDSVYRTSEPAHDEDLNTAGWKSSYTGAPIPDEEMRQWAEDTAQRILRFEPRRVLEIGCGTGLLLSRIAPRCDAYCGMDFSPAALELIQATKGSQPWMRHVRLLQGPAHDLGSFEPGSFDTIILNSVVQYFPDIDYLVDVLKRAARLVRPGGRIFVGDVRNRALLSAFHASVQIARADRATSVGALREQIARQRSREVELVIDPDFFFAFMERGSEAVSDVDLWLKAGSYQNEMVRYRYDAVLHVGAVEAAQRIDWLEWGRDVSSLEELERALARYDAAVGVRGVPNRRVEGDLGALELLDARPAQESLEDALAHRRGIERGVDPQSILEMARRPGFVVEVHCRDFVKPGLYDVVVRESDDRARIDVPTSISYRPWDAYADRPSHERPAKNLAPELHRHLAARLPEYMVPAHIVTLEQLPLTPSGKIDRRLLPAPGALALAGEGYVAPRNPIEERMAEIWSEVLGIARTGIHDDFFKLGGHSLLAVRIITSVRSSFDSDLSLKAIFEAPTIAGLSARVLASSARGTASQHVPTIVSRPEARHLPFPLTEIQQAYWLGRSDSFELGNVATHSYIELRCQDLDLARFSHAWNRLIERHPQLRMIVLPSGQQQVIEPPAPYDVTTVDMRGRSPEERADALRTIREEMSHQVLPADRFPLFEIRASLLDDHFTSLHISFDALIADAWGMRVLGRELSALYERPNAELPALELSFRDYVIAEREWQKSAWYRASHEYWMQRIGTLPSAPGLPLAQDPGALKEPRFTRRSGALQPDDWRALKKRASERAITPSALLLAAFAEVLAGWSKEPRFTLNLTLFNRIPAHRQVHDIVGDFTSLILLEVDQSRGASFLERARALQEQLWRDLDHSRVNGVTVLRELSRQRGQRVGMPVVFTSTLTLPAEGEGEETGPLGEAIYAISQTPQVWLDHQVNEEQGRLMFNWDVVDEIFPAGMIDDMFDVYSRLLARLATSDAPWQGETHVRLPAWQREMLERINRTSGPLPQGLLHTPFLNQVREHSARAAVITPERTLTYADLSRIAAGVAGWLRAAGARPNKLVAIVMEKGWEQIAGAFAVLLSGAAYLPIDPALPDERRRFLLDHGQVDLVLTQSRVDERLSWPDRVRRFSVDRDRFDDIDPLALEAAQGPSDLAYVIFTSGSTGTPKGVMIDHRGALNTVVDINERFGIGPEDRVLALSSLSFDLSVYDVFGVLGAGGAVVLPDPADASDPRHWVGLMRRHRVTVWNTVPALMQMLVDHLGATQSPPEALRLCMLSGDWISTSLAARVRGAWPSLDLISLGGATEASIWSIFHRIDAPDPAWTSIPYGKPLRNQVFHVLDQSLKPCPVWKRGHLYIGGVGLALGYWKSDEQTRAAFIIHPDTRERLYKTGDLGLYRPDGDIEFLGREDTQVKVRGHRIELGEIEAALQQHPAVRDAAVVAPGDRENRHLVAFVVPQKADGHPVDYLPVAANDGAAPAELLPVASRAAVPLSRSAAQARHTSQAQGGPAPLTVDLAGRLFACLRQAKVEGVPLPKYRYASAGSLYPVQTYVLVKGGGIEGLEAGLYYYDPALHGLTLVRRVDVDPRAAWTLLLVGKLDAIAPLYGSLAHDFCVLEAGYMSELLVENAAALEVPLCAADIPDVAALLEERHVVITALAPGEAWQRGPCSAASRRLDAAPTEIITDPIERTQFKLEQRGLRRSPPGAAEVAFDAATAVDTRALLARQSYREFVPDLLPFDHFSALLSIMEPPTQAGMRVCVAIKPGRVEGIDAGVYTYDSERHALTPRYEYRADMADVFGHLRSPNREVFDSAAFATFFIADVESEGHDQRLLDAGRIGQRLMERAPSERVGLCPIGSVARDVCARWLDFSPREGVIHSFVGGRIDPSQTQRWLQPSQPPASLPDALRDHLGRRLPAYMIPTKYIKLESLPLTANGKVDRNALQSLAAGRGAPSQVSGAARTATEEIIARVWSEVLGRPEVGLDDNFFELGGDSLLAARVVAKLRDEHAAPLSLRDVFERLTVAELARRLDSLHIASQMQERPSEELREGEAEGTL